MNAFIASCILLLGTACNNAAETTMRKWPDGQKKVTYTIFAGDSVQLIDVFYKAYYPNGAVFKSGRIKNGLEGGSWSYYYQSGRLQSKGQFIAGSKDGDFEAYYESGQIEQKGNYSNGKLLGMNLFNPDGTEKTYNEDLTRYLVNNPIKWTAKQAEEIRIDCQMAMEPDNLNVDPFCDCILAALQSKCNYADIKPMTANQRGIILNYVTQNQKECFGLLEKRKK